MQIKCDLNHILSVTYFLVLSLINCTTLYYQFNVFYKKNYLIKQKIFLIARSHRH